MVSELDKFWASRVEGVRDHCLLDFAELEEDEFAPVIVIASGDDAWLILADEFWGDERFGTSLEIRHFVGGREVPLPDKVRLFVSSRDARP